MTAYAHEGLASETTRHYRVSALAGDTAGPASNVAHATSDDIVAPELRFASALGQVLRIEFSEALDGASGHTPPKSAFEVIVDGIPTGFETVLMGASFVALSGVSPSIKNGQAVVVTYTDPSANDDIAALQDTAGNDAASFTTGEDGVPAVSLGNVADPVAPDAPAGLVATAAGDMRIDLAWEPPAYNGGTAVTGYRIEVSEDVDPLVWTELAAHHAAMEDGEVVMAYTHTMDCSGGPKEPCSEVTRHYRVSAINAAGTGPASNVASATTGTGAPGEPRELTAMPDGPTLIALAWTAPEAIDGVAAPTGYLIEWSPDGTSHWQYLLRDEEGDPSAVTGTTYSDRGLAPETERYYRVSAINAAGAGRVSNVAQATSARVVALAPTDLAATAGAEQDGSVFVSRIDLAWSAPGDTGNSDLTGYLIEWSPDGTDGSWQALVTDTGSLEVAYADRPLDLGTTRHYRVFAINDDGPGRVSDAAFATTRPVPYQAGTNAGGTQVAIVFEPALDGTPGNAPEKERFTVSVGGVAVEIGALVVAGPSGQVLLNDLSPIIRFEQAVTVGYTDPTDGDDPRAVQDTAGVDAHSFADFPVSNASNVLAVVAEAPIGLMAEAPSDRDDAIELRWSPPGYDGGRAVTGYRIEWSRNGRSSWRDLVPNTGETVGETCSGTPPEDGVAYCDSGLGPRTTRHYRVRAINAVGTGPASNVAHATTTEDVPGAPTGLTATAVDAMPGADTTQIGLAWSAPVEVEIMITPTGYRIEVSEDGGATFTDLVPDTGETVGTDCAGTAPQDGVAYCDTELGSEVTRHYRVSANNDEGTGPASNVADATTDDVAAPVPQTASVPETGTSLTVAFDEALDETAANLPAEARFAVTVEDEAEIAIDEVTVDGTSVTLTGLSPTIKYGQTVTVAYTDPGTGDDTAGALQDGHGNDAASFTGYAVTNGSAAAPTVPGKPRELEAQARGPDRIDLSWNPPSDTGGRPVTAYRIEFSSDGVNFGALVERHATMQAGRVVTAYAHEGIGAGATRHYRIKAINEVGTGPASDSARATTTTSVPGAPEIHKLTPEPATPGDTTTRITLAWTPPAFTGDSDITGYLIKVSPDNTEGSFTTLVENHNTMADGAIVTAYTHTMVCSEDMPCSEETRYYRVSAINDAGTGSPSPVEHTTTVDILGPEPVSASVTGSGVEVAIDFDEALDASTANAPATERFSVKVDDAPVTVGSVTVWGALKQVVLGGFAHAVRSGQTVTVGYADPSSGDDKAGALQDDDGNDAADFTLGGPKDSVTVTNGSIQAPTAPGKPTGLTAEANVMEGTMKADLAWTAPADNGGRGITGYLIEWSTDGTTFPAADRVTITATDAGSDEVVTAYTQTGVSTDDERHYRVSAINAVGTGQASDTVPLTTGLPGAPTAVKATPMDAMAGRHLHPDRPHLDGAGAHGRHGHHRLPDRVVGGRQRPVERAGREHRQHGRR